MTLFFKLQCKALCTFIPALTAMVALQLLMGQMAAIALQERRPEIDVAYFQEEKSDISDAYIEALSASADFDFIAADSMEEKSELFSTGKAHVFLHIPPSFYISVTEGASPAVILYIAPGVTGITLIKEHLADQWLLLRTKALAAEYLGLYIEDRSVSGSETDPVLLNYEGPILQTEMFITPPAFGVPALFLLLAFLHTAGIAVSSDDDYWKMKDKRVLKSSCLVSLLTVFIFWCGAVLLYTAGMRLLFNVAVPGAVLFSFLGLCAYAVTSGGLLSYLGKRSRAAWIFIPLLLVNMTLGGGLWNAGESQILLPAVLPVTAVLASSAGGWAGATILWSQAIAVILLIIGISGVKQRRVPNKTCYEEDENVLQ